LLDSMVIAIPLGDEMGHSFATIDIEYEWKHPRCSTCKIFDHMNNGCPKNPKVIKVSNGTSDGYTKVRRKKNKSKQNRQIEGEEMVLEDKNGKRISKKGASTPVVNVSS
ncbi:hypothetical protein Tco_1120625, partial [Tanacetum coccineum]